MTPSQNSRAEEEARTIYCDGCGSWTARPVTDRELRGLYGWTVDEEDGERVAYCLECS